MTAVRLDRLFNLALIATLSLKIILASSIAMTGDEVYHLLLGQTLNFGVYDHPPVLGWILHFLQLFTDANLVLRAPSSLLSLLIGLVSWLLQQMLRF